MNASIIEARFAALVEKAVLGTATPQELAKLERWEALRWQKRTPQERHNDEVLHYQVTQAAKQIEGLLWQIKQTQTPNQPRPEA